MERASIIRIKDSQSKPEDLISIGTMTENAMKNEIKELITLWLAFQSEHKGLRDEAD